MSIHQPGRCLRLLAIAAGCALLGASALGGAKPAEAAMPIPAPLAPAPLASPAAPGAIQPVYWAYDRFGRRVWVERPYYRPPPPRHHHRRGWVDRYGRWHPY